MFNNKEKLREINPMAFAGLSNIKPQLDQDAVFSAIERIMGVEIYLLVGKKRQRHIVDARKVFCYIMKENSRLSLESIGFMINKDHATVLHSINTLKKLIEYDRQLKSDLEEVEKMALSGRTAFKKDISITPTDTVWSYHLKQSSNK